ncbi:MAG: Acetyltransferase [Devosia sp.]|nr:Acetyltransferase [Devosia sp.]
MRLETARLVLRLWRDDDKPRYAEVIGDPEVRRFFPSVGTLIDATIALDRAMARYAEHGYTMLAVERRADAAFVGMLGLAPLSDALRAAIPGAPAVEIGWQFGRRFWGQGYAPEAAQAMLDLAWDTLKLPEVVAITTVTNAPSRRVMEKLGMHYDPLGDFDHPDVPIHHPFRRHLLYRIANPRP